MVSMSVSICLCTHTPYVCIRRWGDACKDQFLFSVQFLLNNFGTSVSIEGTVIFVIGTGLKHRSIGVSEIDVLDVLCLHQNSRCSQMFIQQCQKQTKLFIIIQSYTF